MVNSDHFDQNTHGSQLSTVNKTSPERQERSYAQSTGLHVGRKWKRRKLTTLREDLYCRRLALKEKRNEIREERSYLDELEARLIGSITQSLSLSTDLNVSLIIDLHTEIVAKKDELGNLEYEYDQAEADYDIAEDEYNEFEYLEKDKPDHSSSFEIATQSSDGNSEAHAKEGFHIRLERLEQVEEELKRQQRIQFNQLHKRSSDARSTSQPRSDSIHYRRGSGAQPLAVREDSEHDVLEATFLMRTTTPPIAENNTIRPHAVVSHDSGQFQELDHTKSDIKQWESNSHPGFTWNNELGSSQTHNHSKARSDSGLTTHRRGLIRRRSRIIRWLFTTFGSSFVDYLARARDKQHSDTGTLDDETWARLVYGYWTRRRIPPAMADTTGEIHDSIQVEHQSLGGNYLLIPPSLSKIRHSVRYIDKLFEISPTESDILAQVSSLDEDLSSLLTPTRAMQP